MKNLFINMGSSISIRSLVKGKLNIREFSADEVASFIATTRKQGGKTIGHFELGSVPSTEKERNFHQLLVAFEVMTGTRLTRDDFFSDPVGDGELMPNFNYVPRVNETSSMLVVEYYFEMDMDRFAENDGGKDVFSVSQDHMDFYLFEHNAGSR
ncbi:hypothetical protein FDK21_20195 [Cohaesibacter sp. CAU 1516]|uniref:hypothetical protein n=1 Tax=Cohaesibacter sp. CAU 1516 TaxID=2576038 RepID=UPI0010FEDB65|nr:hypothetical protein [Cohaesibacter sp. CAU 1516]TLP42155.1 hypothetical protein FDK21_20195 [Cohaesibacter sp. CAU 1516]